MTDRHITSIMLDAESFQRGGSTRIAQCVCGWNGPERGTMQLAADDALEHESPEMPGAFDEVWGAYCERLGGWLEDTSGKWTWNVDHAEPYGFRDGRGSIRQALIDMINNGHTDVGDPGDDNVTAFFRADVLILRLK